MYTNSISASSFSIVTIVYNNLAHIKKTIESVINQSYKNIEYILVDGWSNDGTKEAIMELISSCATITLEKQEEEKIYLEATYNTYPYLTFKFLSERDKGIYDAMNKGIILASREWINFMNCGDRFYNLEVLQKVANENIERYDVVYGNTEVLCSMGYKYICYAKKNGHKYHHHFIHQSSFVKTKIMKKIPYDTRFKIAGDTDFFTKIYNRKYNFHKLDLTISVFSLDGLSSSLTWQLFYEDCKIGFKYNRLFPLYLAIKWILWTIPKKQIKKIFS